MPPKRKVFHEVVKDKEDFERIIADNPTRVNIFDCHLEWCGPCKCMEDNFKALWFSIEGDPEGRVAFWQVSEESLPEEWAQKLKLTLIPKFIVVQHG